MHLIPGIVEGQDHRTACSPPALYKILDQNRSHLRSEVAPLHPAFSKKQYFVVVGFLICSLGKLKIPNFAQIEPQYLLNPFSYRETSLKEGISSSLKN